ncbi:hypothetical protein DFH07DRAFT_1064788 [Mycena maculata]|uniref:Uncharacterized protein n=1 Tax=Mycena maculata TaxID=230809 RepID=A0AAD7MY36_9AGAR|nr:hypothetical protein DFH07DRAFT_1064788 [Mycena maculata]
MHNLWTSCSRKTRSSAVFTAWMPEVHVLRAQDFQFGPLVTRAVAAESDDQEDHEPDDDMDDIDVEWPPNPNNSIDEEWPLRDPSNDIDDPPAASSSSETPTLLIPSFDDLLATGKPQTGNHRRRAAKRAKGIQHEGY